MKINYYQMPLQNKLVSNLNPQLHYNEQISPIQQRKNGTQNNYQFGKFLSRDIPTLSTQNNHSKSLQKNYDMPRLMKLFEEDSKKQQKMQLQISNLDEEYKDSIHRQLFTQRSQQLLPQMSQYLFSHAQHITNNNITDNSSVVNSNNTYDAILKRRNNSNKRIKTLQATFKPRQLISNLQNIKRHESTNNFKKNYSNLSTKKTNMEGYLLGNGNIRAKTKYEKILKQHLQSQKQQNKNKSTVNVIPEQCKEAKVNKIVTSDQLSKQSQQQKKPAKKSLTTQKKDSAVKKGNQKVKQLKQNEIIKNMKRSNSVKIVRSPLPVHYERYPSNTQHSSYQKILQNISSSRKKAHYSSSNKLLDAQQLNKIPKYGDKYVKISYTNNTLSRQHYDGYHKNKSLSANKSQVQCNKQTGWMKMGFHERQQHALTSRLNKQKMGLKNKAEEQVRGCTFHPQLQSTSGQYAGWYNQPHQQKQQMIVDVNSMRSTYLGQYLGKLYPRY